MAGRELPNVAEDEDEGAEGKPNILSRTAGSVWRRLYGDKDVDQVFAYETFITVRVRDWKLGIIYWTSISVIVLYILMGCFAIDRRHQEADPGVGTVLTKVFGKAHLKGDTSIVYDSIDIRNPVIEPAGAFIMTKRITVAQKFGSCVDWDNPLPCPCKDGGVCNGDHCESQGWCPSIGNGNADKPPPEAKVEELEGLEDMIISIHAAIAFPYAGNYFYVATPGPKQPDLKKISLGGLLAEAGMKVTDVTQTGALIGVNLLWTCELSFLSLWTGDVPTGLGEQKLYCPYHFSVVRLDGGGGFTQKRSRRKGDTREAFYNTGIRIIVESTGRGNRLSLVLVAIQVGSMFSLLKCATSLTDSIMVNKRIMGKKKADSCLDCKVENTEDYTDLKDRLDEVRKLKQNYRNKGGSSRMVQRRGGGGQGGDLSLSLGAGGRGGSGTAVLRGT